MNQNLRTNYGTVVHKYRKHKNTLKASNDLRHYKQTVLRLFLKKNVNTKNGKLWNSKVLINIEIWSLHNGDGMHNKLYNPACFLCKM